MAHDVNREYRLCSAMSELTFLGEYGIIIYAMKLGNAQFAKPSFAFAGGGLVHQKASEIPEVPGKIV